VLNQQPNRICLLRHAEAVDERRELPDPARHLSAAGRQQAITVGRQLASYFAAYLRQVSLLTDGVTILCSPLVRSVQTAERVALALGLEQDVICEPLLAPGSDTGALVKRLGQQSAMMIVVGHEPGLSALGAQLTGSVGFSMLDKAQAVFIEANQESWRWLHHNPAPLQSL
jgi:phosphohistidine phosphatase SixA